RPLPHVARQTIADLRDEKPLRRAIARCDAIVQLAAMSNDPLGELDPTLMRQVNHGATLRVIALAAGRPLVLYSSASVYGANDEPCTEDSAVRPLTLYSELKLATEHVALERANALVLRNGTVHGPAPVPRGDLLLNAMAASAVTSGEIVLTTEPATRRPVIDVRDLATLTVGLLERRVAGLYNVAAANISVGEAARLVARMSGAGVVERYDRADPRNYAMDVSKLMRLVGAWWRPRSLEASITDLVADYRDIGLTASEVATRRYHRVGQFLSRAPVDEAAAQ
ncbi:MAG TPA: SDR family oxidoreductase, partial [Candidatus Limnocylindria bacterium]|nr:SDR family oxidoreductase [Candidatus Limnocylindria bacterium]